MFHVVVVGELQDRLADGLTQPNHGTANQLVVPIATVDQPWRIHPGQFGGSGLIQHNESVGMFLQKRRRDLIGDGAFHSFLNNGSFAFTPGHHDRPF